MAKNSSDCRHRRLFLKNPYVHDQKGVILVSFSTLWIEDSFGPTS